jgi:hypothetical protein
VCWRWPNWVFWISLLAVLTLADMDGYRKIEGKIKYIPKKATDFFLVADQILGIGALQRM